MNKYIILASKSERRSKILTSCRIRHKIFVAGVKEHMCSKMTISRLVMFNAQKKAQAAADVIKKGIILGVDTLVLLGGEPIGKPKTEKQARQLLQALNGRKVFVYSGLCLVDVDTHKQAKCFDKTQLTVKRIDRKDLSGYFELLKPYDKAGGFSIEGTGSILFDDLKGSYFNVLGLPMGRLKEAFDKIGRNILDFMR